jgi:uncharacterized protein (TIGR00369 family)
LAEKLAREYDMAEDRFGNAPVSQWIGYQVEPGPSGQATVRVEVDERWHNPMGRVHGGMVSALADAAMGIAFGRTLDDGQDFATIDLHVHFMRPVTGARLTAIAQVQQRGLRVGFVECRIEDDRKRWIASANCSCTIIDS